MKIIPLTIFAILLTGCARKTPAPQVDVSALRSQLGEATERADAAEQARAELVRVQDAKDEAELDRAGKTKAVLDETGIDLGMGLIDLAKLNVKLALAWYAQVQADPELQIWLANQRAAHESGRADEVARNYDAAMADGKALAGRIGILTEQLDNAKASESKARTEALEARNALAVEVERHAKEIEDAKRIERDLIAAETRAAQVRMANTAGGICGIIALACIAGAVWLSAAAAKFLRGAAVSGVLCAECFGFARFAASPLFVPVVGTVSALLLSGWIAWEVRGAIRKRDADKEASLAKERADGYSAFGTKVIPIIDELYERKDLMQEWVNKHTNGTESDYVDEQLLAVLAASMDDKTKAVVHEIRASIKLASANHDTEDTRENRS